LVHSFNDSIESLNAPIFAFSCQLAERARLRVEKTWNDYQALQIVEQFTFPSPLNPQPRQVDLSQVENERRAMLRMLSNLRDIIAKS
jgi:hypothetical protein